MAFKEKSIDDSHGPVPTAPGGSCGPSSENPGPSGQLENSSLGSQQKLSFPLIVIFLQTAVSERAMPQSWALYSLSHLAPQPLQEVGNKCYTHTASTRPAPGGV